LDLSTIAGLCGVGGSCESSAFITSTGSGSLANPGAVVVSSWGLTSLLKGPVVGSTNGLAPGGNSAPMDVIHAKSQSGPTYLLVSGQNSVAVPRSISVVPLKDSEYRVEVHGAPENFLLVMNSTYSSEWSLASPSANIKVAHIAVNGGENGWLISGPKGDYSLVASYTGTGSITWGLIGSVVAAIMALAIAFKARRRASASPDFS